MDLSPAGYAVEFSGEGWGYPVYSPPPPYSEDGCFGESWSYQTHSPPPFSRTHPLIHQTYSFTPSYPLPLRPPDPPPTFFQIQPPDSYQIHSPSPYYQSQSSIHHNFTPPGPPPSYQTFTPLDPTPSYPPDPISQTNTYHYQQTPVVSEDVVNFAHVSHMLQIHTEAMNKFQRSFEASFDKLQAGLTRALDKAFAGFKSNFLELDAEFRRRLASRARAELPSGVNSISSHLEARSEGNTVSKPMFTRNMTIGVDPLLLCDNVVRDVATGNLVGNVDVHHTSIVGSHFGDHRASGSPHAHDMFDRMTKSDYVRNDEVEQSKSEHSDEFEVTVGNGTKVYNAAHGIRDKGGTHVVPWNSTTGGVKTEAVFDQLTEDATDDDETEVVANATLLGVEDNEEEGEIKKKLGMLTRGLMLTRGMSFGCDAESLIKRAKVYCVLGCEKGSSVKEVSRFCDIDSGFVGDEMPKSGFVLYGMEELDVETCEEVEVKPSGWGSMKFGLNKKDGGSVDIIIVKSDQADEGNATSELKVSNQFILISDMLENALEGRVKVDVIVVGGLGQVNGRTLAEKMDMSIRDKGGTSRTSDDTYSLMRVAYFSTVSCSPYFQKFLVTWFSELGCVTNDYSNLALVSQEYFSIPRLSNGRSYEVQKTMMSYPFDIISKYGKPCFPVANIVGTIEYSPEEIFALILKHDGDVFDVLRTNCATELGGDYFDMSIVKYLVVLIHKKLGRNISSDNRTVGKLKVEAKQAKRALSSHAVVHLCMDSSFVDVNFCETLTRARSEELNKDLFRKAMEMIKNAIDESGFQKVKIDEVLLVGGNTRILRVQQMVLDCFGGKKARNYLNPEGIYAYGAAVHASTTSTLNQENSTEKVKKKQLDTILELDEGIYALCGSTIVRLCFRMAFVICKLSVGAICQGNILLFRIVALQVYHTFVFTVWSVDVVTVPAKLSCLELEDKFWLRGMEGYMTKWGYESNCDSWNIIELGLNPALLSDYVILAKREHGWERKYKSQVSTVLFGTILLVAGISCRMKRVRRKEGVEGSMVTVFGSECTYFGIFLCTSSRWSLQQGLLTDYALPVLNDSVLKEAQVNIAKLLGTLAEPAVTYHYDKLHCFAIHDKASDKLKLDVKEELEINTSASELADLDRMAIVLVIVTKDKQDCKWVTELSFSGLILVICRLIDWIICQGHLLLSAATLKILKSYHLLMFNDWSGATVTVLTMLSCKKLEDKFQLRGMDCYDPNFGCLVCY